MRRVAGCRPAQVEDRELDHVEARLEGAPERVRSELRTRFLRLLNKTKEDVRAVNQALEEYEHGRDGLERLAGPVSPGREPSNDFYDDQSDDDEPAGLPEPAPSGSSAWLRCSSSPSPRHALRSILRRW